jgi:hypothetical protein
VQTAAVDGAMPWPIQILVTNALMEVARWIIDAQHANSVTQGEHEHDKERSNTQVQCRHSERHKRCSQSCFERRKAINKLPECKWSKCLEHNTATWHIFGRAGIELRFAYNYHVLLTISLLTTLNTILTQLNLT